MLTYFGALFATAIYIQSTSAIKHLHSLNSSDIFAIQNTIALYTIYLDSKNFAGFTSIFTADVHADYSYSPAWNGVSEIQGNLSAALANVTTQHSLTTQYIEVLDAEKANVTTYLIAQHFGKGAYEGEIVVAYGKYEDMLMLTGGAWKIARRAYIPMV